MKRSLLTRYLDFVERVGNALPHPVTLFLCLVLVVILASFVASMLGISVIHPGTGEAVFAFNLASREGMQRMMLEAVKNFTSFAPLGIVLFAILGVSVAERSGFIAAALRTSVKSVPRALLPAVLIFCGVNSSLAGDAGFIILPPLGALVFASVGRHPMAGLAAAFAGVAGGFSASVFVTALDVLLSGLTQDAARMVAPSYVVHATANYYFMCASAVLVTVCGTFVTTRIVEPRLGAWVRKPEALDDQFLDPAVERRALRWSFVAFCLFVGISLLLVVPHNGILRDPDGSLRPFFESIVILVTATLFLCGLTYGVVARTIRSDRDAASMLGDGMSAMGMYVVLAFVIAQFVAYFKWSNLGFITAVSGANALTSLHLPSPLLLIAFVGFAVVIDLFIGSSSAKWAVMAPVFVPMFMLMGISPETVQATYRIGDSIGNATSPLLPYLPIVIMVARRYKSDASVGTMISTMMPYSIVFGLAWTMLLLAWLLLDLPIGPGVSAFLR